MIDYSIDGDGIATLAFNLTDRSTNVLNEESLAAFGEHVQDALADESVVGVIVTSAKKEFIVGADLTTLLLERDPTVLMDRSTRLQKLLRSIERGRTPFVAAINGTALGGGYEICLACHHRIAADNPSAQIGLPEVTLGLLPGAGGTQRLPRMIGIGAALRLLLDGTRLDPRKALQLGLVDKVVPAHLLLDTAKQWLLREGAKSTVKPWDKKGFKLPDGPVQSAKGHETFMAANALTHEQTHGHYPAARAILSCVYEGCQVDINTALRIESRYAIHCMLSPQAKNMIRTSFFSMNEVNKLPARPRDVAPTEYTRIGILGAGMMGSAIAYVSALAGLNVVLLDRFIETAEKGKSYAKRLLDKKVQEKLLTESERDDILRRIRLTTDYASLRGCELVIEAVYEDRSLKAEVTQRAEAVMSDDAVFGSDTSTLPITGLAESSRRPENFIGLHFFSPVDKMQLVEIIVGRKTSDECLAKAMDFARVIKKTPIVVNDSRSFYTSRVFASYVLEGIAMLAEGIRPALIENAGRMGGMPLGPLAVADEISIELIYKIRKQTQKDLGAAMAKTVADEVIDKMVERLERRGKKVNRGFYDYTAGNKQLWPELAEHFPVSPKQPNAQTVIRRLMYIQSLETVRCLEEKVVRSPQDADVGSILGWGFAPFLGGTISQIHTIGVRAFVAECEQMGRVFGSRFSPPALLVNMVTKGESFYPF